MVYGVFQFVPFIEASDAELVFSFPYVVSFFPEIKSDGSFSGRFKDHYGFPPFGAFEDRDVIDNLVEFGYRQFFTRLFLWLFDWFRHVELHLRFKVGLQTFKGFTLETWLSQSFIREELAVGFGDVLQWLIM